MLISISSGGIVLHRITLRLCRTLGADTGLEADTPALNLGAGACSTSHASPICRQVLETSKNWVSMPVLPAFQLRGVHLWVFECAARLPHNAPALHKFLHSQVAALDGRPMTELCVMSRVPAF